MGVAKRQRLNDTARDKMVCHWQTGTHVTGATSRWYVLSPASGQLLHTVIYDQLARQCRSARQSRMPCLSMLLLVTNAVAWNKLSLAYFKSVITACTWHGASNAIKTKQSGQPSTSIPLSPLPFPPPTHLIFFCISSHPLHTPLQHKERKHSPIQSPQHAMSAETLGADPQSTMLEAEHYCCTDFFEAKSSGATPSSISTGTSTSGDCHISLGSVILPLLAAPSLTRCVGVLAHGARPASRREGPVPLLLLPV